LSLKAARAHRCRPPIFLRYGYCASGACGAAKARSTYLDRGSDLVIVATHDVEVLDLLGDAYAPLHFREQVVDGALSFDYRIRRGPASTRNAIALLELMQFPPDLVENALATIDWQRRRETVLPEH
jgi:DNA mismatch repair ATPase MutS